MNKLTQPHSRPNRRRALALIAALAILPGAAMAQGKPAGARPESVVRELVEAMQANDAARIRAAFHANASQAYGSGAAKSGARFRAWLESDIIKPHGRVSNPQYAAKGNEVVVTGQYANNSNYRSAANFLMRVEDGKVISWQMRY